MRTDKKSAKKNEKPKKKTRVEHVEAEEIEDTPKSKKSKVKTESTYPVSEREHELSDLVTEINKLVRVNSISLSSEDRVSSGMLCLNLLLGGGIAPGMYTFYGPEQSAKTTAAITVLAASVKGLVDLRVLWDAENSSGSSTDYVANIFNTVGCKATVDQVFQGDTKNGKLPLVIYRDDYEAEKVFDWIHALQKRLPDKRFENGNWWYVYDETKENKAKVKDYDKKMTSMMNGGIWKRAEDGRLQAIILLDSYPSLVPAKADSDEGDNSIAVQARMFSKQLPRIKGSFRAKRIALIGINQLRINPMARFGNPETEPGGQSLKFFSDVRFRFYPRALSGVPFNPKGEGQVEKEKSVTVEGGEDVYRYIHVSAVKNKLSMPGRQTWLRIWVSDANGDARGYCPVWDSFYYAAQTGQLTGKRNQIKLNVKGLGEAERSITWLEFKTLILGSKQDMSDICAKIGYKSVNLREGFFRQLASGKGEDLYIAHNRPKATQKGDEDDDTEDTDD